MNKKQLIELMERKLKYRLGEYYADAPGANASYSLGYNDAMDVIRDFMEDNND